MIEIAWLFQSLLPSDDANKEENGTSCKTVVAWGNVAPLATHIFQLFKRSIKKEISGSSRISITINVARLQNLESHETTPDISFSYIFAF